METSNNICILCLNLKSLELYNQSIGVLNASKCFDYMVYRVVDMDMLSEEEAKEWLTSVPIDEVTYSEIHKSLCKKLQKLMFDKIS